MRKKVGKKHLECLPCCDLLEEEIFVERKVVVMIGFVLIVQFRIIAL